MTRSSTTFFTSLSCSLTPIPHTPGNVYSSTRGASLNRGTYRVREANLFQASTLHPEQLRACHYHREALRARDRNVESISAEEKVHSSWYVFGTRRRHRIEDDWSFLPLELVDRSDLGSLWKNAPERGDLSVVGSDDQNVIDRDPMRSPFLVRVLPPDQRLEGVLDRFGLLVGPSLAPSVIDFQETEAGASDDRTVRQAAIRALIIRAELPSIELLRDEVADIHVHAIALV